MKANWYAILTDCIERGLLAGYRRAHKHTDKPSEEQLLEHQLNEITNCLSYWIIFDDECASRQGDGNDGR